MLSQPGSSLVLCIIVNIIHLCLKLSSRLMLPGAIQDSGMQSSGIAWVYLVGHLSHCCVFPMINQRYAALVTLASALIASESQAHLTIGYKNVSCN